MAEDGMLARIRPQRPTSFYESNAFQGWAALAVSAVLTVIGMYSRTVLAHWLLIIAWGSATVAAWKASAAIPNSRILVAIVGSIAIAFVLVFIDSKVVHAPQVPAPTPITAQEVYMQVADVKLVWERPLKFPSVEVYIVNAGRAPGKIERQFLRSAVIEKPKDPKIPGSPLLPFVPSRSSEESAFALMMGLQPTVNIPPIDTGIQEPIVTKLVVNGYSEEYINDLLNGTKWLFATGRIEFSDASGPHYMEFCKFFAPTNTKKFLHLPSVLKSDPFNVWAPFLYCSSRNGRG